jgi:hypothetical protein
MISLKKFLITSGILIVMAPADLGAMALDRHDASIHRNHLNSAPYTAVAWDWNSWFGKKPAQQNQVKKAPAPLATARDNNPGVEIESRKVTAQTLMQNLAKSNAANDAAFNAMQSRSRARQEQLKTDLARYEQTRDWSHQAEEQRIMDQISNQKNNSQPINVPQDAQRNRIFLKPDDLKKPPKVFSDYGP